MDIDGMVKAIVGAEQAPKQAQLKRLEAKTTTQLTSLGQLKSAISTFQSALSALNSPSSFLARSVSSSDSKVASSTASQSAVAGGYKIDVEKLASGSKVALAAAVDTADAKFSTGTLTIAVGDTSLDIVLDASNNTLAGMRDAINGGGVEGLSATIVNDDKGARLVLTSTKSGDGNDIAVSISGETAVDGAASLGLLSYSGQPEAPIEPDAADIEKYPLGVDDAAYKADKETYQAELAAYEKAGRTLAVAQSAKFTVDGLAVTRDTNFIDNVVGGLSFDLKSTGATTLTVTRDEAGVQANVKKFVDAYNTLASYINTETKVTTVNETAAPVTGALVGDSSVRSLLNGIRATLVAPQGSGGMRALADMGITTKKDGTLEMDATKVGKAIKSNFSEVAAYFTGDTGLTARLGNVLKPYTDSNGILESRTDALQSTIDKVDKQKVELTARMKAVEERLYKQFNAMDSLVGQLTRTSESLTQLFDSMPGFVTQKD